MESSNGSDTNVGGIENSIKNERSSIEKDIKIALDKFSDNKDIDSAILIVEKFILGNYILRGGRKNIVKDSLRYILSDYKKLQEEFKQVDYECNRLEKIDFEKDMRIIELQKENKELKNQEATVRKINELLVQRYSNSIPKSKLKDIIDRIDYDIKKTKEIISKNTNIYASYRKNDYQIVRLRAMNTKSLDIKKRLQELLESEE